MWCSAVNWYLSCLCGRYEISSSIHWWAGTISYHHIRYPTLQLKSSLSNIHCMKHFSWEIIYMYCVLSDPNPNPPGWVGGYRCGCAAPEAFHWAHPQCPLCWTRRGSLHCKLTLHKGSSLTNHIASIISLFTVLDNTPLPCGRVHPIYHFHVRVHPIHRTFLRHSLFVWLGSCCLELDSYPSTQATSAVSRKRYVYN